MFRDAKQINMIKEVLDTLKNRLEEHLGYLYDLPDGLVQLGGIPSSSEEAPNKLILSVLNLERETAMGINYTFRKEKSGDMMEQAPAWNLNVSILLASVYNDLRYADSLKVLSSAIHYIQQKSSFSYSNERHFTIEMVTLNIQELTNIWSLFGGHYYPSIVCKLRMLTFDGDRVLSTTRETKDVNLHVHK